MPPLTPMQQLVADEANRQGIDPAVALSLAEQESNFEPRAVSPTGVTGLLQVTIPTGLPYGQTASTRTNPQVSAQAGMMALRDNIKRAGSVEGGLKAYGDPKQTGFASQVLARVPKWRAVMAEQQPGATAEDVYRDMGMSGALGTPPSAATAEDVSKAMETPQSAQAQAQPPNQGLTSSWWKPLNPAEHPTLAWWLRDIPGSEAMMQQGPGYLRDIAAGGVRWGAEALALSPEVMSGPWGWAAIPPTAAAASVAARHVNQVLGLEEGDPRTLSSGDLWAAASGAAGTAPLSVLNWLRAPAKTALRATDVANEAVKQTYMDDLATYAWNVRAGKPATPPSPPTWVAPTAPERGVISKGLEKALPFEVGGLLANLPFHPLETLKYGTLPAALTGMDMLRRWETARLLQPGRLADLRAMGISPLQAGLAAAAAERARQQLAPSPSGASR